jgi:transcriptional regulator with XRE-family HTH domain
VATRQRPIERGVQVSRRLRIALGLDIRAARTAAGLSQRDVGRNAGLDHTLVGRIERGLYPSVTLAQLACLCAAVGLDLSARAFVGGDAIRDAGHVRLFERLRVTLHASLSWRTEVPLPGPGDQRAWDAIVSRGSIGMGVEAETVLSDVQAQTRRATLKQRDGGLDSMILLVADTRHNRIALATCRESIREAFPLDTRRILVDLRTGSIPERNDILRL